MRTIRDYKPTNRWYEHLGHVALGILPIDLLLWAREYTNVKLGWPLSGQWPPGKPREFEGEIWAPLDRVADVGWDTLGYDIGRTIRFVVMLSLLVWRW